MTDKTIWANISPAANDSALARQYISEPMQAGVAFITSDTVKCYARASESGANDNINLQPICVKVYSQDGTTLRATMLALGHIGPNTTEWIVTTSTNKTWADGDVLTTGYTTVAGDRLVIEIGGQVSAAGGTTATGTIVFGANSATNLGENETDTAANNPWFEISRNISFLPCNDGDAEPAGGALRMGMAAMRSFMLATALTTQLAGQIYDDQVIVPSRRLYLSSRLPQTVEQPAFSGSWDDTANIIRLRLLTLKDGSPWAGSTVEAFKSGSVPVNTKIATAQHISYPLAAGVVFRTTDVVSMQMQCREQTADDNINRQPLTVKVCSRDGTVIRATLLALAHYGPSTTEWVLSTFTNRTFANHVALDTGYTTVAGDRLVIEYGAQVESGTGGTDVLSDMAVGAGDINDLPVDETAAAGTKNPWFEISTPLQFEPPYEYSDEWWGGVNLSGVVVAQLNYGVIINQSLASGRLVVVDPDERPTPPTPQYEDDTPIRRILSSSWLAPRFLQDQGSAVPPAGVIVDTDDVVPQVIWPQKNQWLTLTDEEIVPQPAGGQAFEDDVSQYIWTGSPWFASLFMQPQDTSVYITIEDDQYQPPLPWPDRYKYLTFNGDDEVVQTSPVVDTDDVVPIVIWPQKYQSINSIDEEIVPQPPPFVAEDDPWNPLQLCRVESYKQPIIADTDQRPIPLNVEDDIWSVGKYTNPVNTFSPLYHSDEIPDAALPLLVDENEQWIGKYTYPTNQWYQLWHSDEIEKLFVDDNVWAVSGYTRPVNNWLQLWHTDEVVTQSPPLTVDDDPSIRSIRSGIWLAPLFLQPQPRTNATPTPLTVCEDEWNVNRHKPYEHKWLKYLYDYEEAPFVTLIDDDNWQPDTIWPQDTIIWSEPDPGNDITQGITVDELYEQFIPKHVGYKSQQYPLYVDDNRSPTLDDDSGFVPSIRWNWQFAPYTLNGDDVIANEVGLDEDYVWSPCIVWPNITIAKVQTGTDDEVVTGTTIDDLYEQFIGRYSGYKLSVQALFSSDDFIFTSIVDDYYGVVPSIKWLYPTQQIFADDGNWIQHYETDEYKLELPKWSVPPLIRPFVDDEVIAFVPVPIGVDEDQFPRFVVWESKTLSRIATDDDVITTAAPPLLVDENETGPLPKPNLWWINKLILWDASEIAQNISLAPARLDAITSEILSGGAAAPQAQLQGITLEVLYDLPIQPVRTTNDQIEFIGKSEAKGAVTSTQVQFFGFSPAIAHVTWDHVDFAGWSPASAKVTWLHIDVLITRGPPPPEECPTTPYECAEPTLVPYECVVVAPIVCEGLGPEVLIECAPLPCPPIGETLGIGPIPSGTLLTIEDTIVTEDDVVWQPVIYRIQFNRIILWSDEGKT